MTLRARIIFWNLVALLLSVVVTAVVATGFSRESVNDEVASAMISVERALGDARVGPGTVAAFDDNRHVRVSYIDETGRVLARSRVESNAVQAPRWAIEALTPSIAPVTIPAGSGRYLVEPVPENEIAEVWVHSRGASLFRVLSAVLLVLILSIVIERALRPLRELRTGLEAIGRGDYTVRVSAKGPPEIVELLDGFNRMGADLAVSEARNRALQQRLERVQEEERADLARDLHDEVGSYLFAANMDCATIIRMAEAGRVSDVRGQAEGVQQALGHMQSHVRGMLERLRAEPTFEMDLVQGLRDICEFWRLRAPSAEFTLDLPDEGPNLDSRRSTSLQRVAQEALTNAVRHGKPTHVHLALTRLGDVWELLVRDNGCGAASANGSPGYGLQGMRERAAAAGAELAAGPSPDGGWTVRVRLVQSREQLEGVSG